MKRTTWTLGLVVGLGACGGNDEPADAGEPVDRVGLRPFQSCDAVLGWTHQEALDRVGAYGLNGDQDYWGGGEDGGDGEGGLTGTAGGEEGGDDGGGTDPSGGGGDAPDYSGTNVQELGVDEPDVVKTDGTRILALAQGRLHYVTLEDGGPTLTGTLELADSTYDPEFGYPLWANEMLVQGDRVILIAQRWGYELPPAVAEAFEMGAEDWYGLTQLIEVDISDPSSMRVLSNLYLDGQYASARKIDGIARFVLRFMPRNLAFEMPWKFLEEMGVQPETGGYSERQIAMAERLAEAHNRKVVLATDVDDWLPRFVHEDFALAEPTYRVGRLVDCDRAYEPGTFAGLGLLSVLTVDMDQGLALRDAVGVFSEGETVYASTESLYVATWPQWENLSEDERGVTEQTEIVSYVHKFDISSTRATEYRASGEVPGALHSQWSMSEHEGALRVATTDFGGWWANEQSQSYVSVLQENGRSLATVGKVGGIGIGEQIFGVRFIGDTGYVVTFEQTDPLFTVDLKDPARPKVVGELQMPGYSAYLHPMSKDVLIGIGREGDADGQLTGAAIKLFDVSDPANPTEIAAATFGEQWASSTVEWDHHAFLYWAPEQIVVIPVQSDTYDEETGAYDFFAGALAYRVDPEAGITLAGVIEHQPAVDEWGYEYLNAIERSLVVGDDLFTLSQAGIATNDLADITPNAWVPFGAP